MVSELGIQRAMYRSAIATGLVWLTSCGPAAETIPTRPTLWDVAPESSRLSRMPVDETGVGSLTRCWPVEGSWDCLYVMESRHQSAVNYFVQRVIQPELLPGDSWSLGEKAKRIDYLCSFTVDYPGAFHAKHLEESLSRDGAILRNTRYPDSPQIDSRAWTSDKVGSFVSENGGEGGSIWFNCDHIARLAAQGSSETFTTSALRHRELSTSVTSRPKSVRAANSTKTAERPNQASLGQQRRANSLSATQRAKVELWRAENHVCRGANDPVAVDVACAKREQIGLELTAVGLCYGHRDDRGGIDYIWHACEAGSDR